MTQLNTITWLFPILFMLHDFEEIILLEAWQKSCKQDLKNKKLKRIIFSNCNNTPAFSIAVAIEFLLISLIALITTLTQNYYVWYALFFAFTLHLILHCAIIFPYKHYVPGVINAILLLPINIYILFMLLSLLPLTPLALIITCLSGTTAMLLLLKALHKYMHLFELTINNFTPQ